MLHGHHNVASDLLRGSECPNCGGTDFVDNYAEAERVCEGCGMVVDTAIIEYPDWKCYDSLGTSGRAKSREAMYKRRYHFNERLAQWYCTGPSPPEFTIGAVERVARATRVRNANRINYTFIKKVLVNIGQAKYCERWIACRREVLRRLRIPARMHFLSDSDYNKFVHMFAVASDTFDRILYRSGRKRTSRDNIHSSDHELSRHNFPNYNFTIQMLLFQLGKHARKKVDAHFYFPLLKTDKVLEKLRCMWKIIADEHNWKAPPVRIIRDKTYSLDY